MWVTTICLAERTSTMKPNESVKQSCALHVETTSIHVMFRMRYYICERQSLVEYLHTTSTLIAYHRMFPLQNISTRLCGVIWQPDNYLTRMTNRMTVPALRKGCLALSLIACIRGAYELRIPQSAGFTVVEKECPNSRARRG